MPEPQRLRWAVLAVLAGTAPARAQMPTDAQKSDIRSSCRSDYQRYCASVPTGGRAALSCLQQNQSGLSGACRAAVGAIGKPAADAPSAASAPSQPPAPAAGSGRPAGDLRAVCGTDVRSFCAGSRPGGGQILECLRRNGPSLSPGCRDGRMAVRDR